MEYLCIGGQSKTKNDQTFGREKFHAQTIRNLRSIVESARNTFVKKIMKLSEKIQIRRESQNLGMKKSEKMF